MRILSVVCLLFLTACASLNTVSVTSIPTQRQKQVKSEVSKWVFLGFSFDNDFVNPLSKQLSDQCPQGKVMGILTKHETYSYVLMFQHIVKAEGFCVSHM